MHTRNGNILRFLKSLNKECLQHTQLTEGIYSFISFLMLDSLKT